MPPFFICVCVGNKERRWTGGNEIGFDLRLLKSRLSSGIHSFSHTRAVFPFSAPCPSKLDFPVCNCAASCGKSHSQSTKGGGKWISVRRMPKRCAKKSPTFEAKKMPKLCYFLALKNLSFFKKTSCIFERFFLPNSKPSRQSSFFPSYSPQKKSFSLCSFPVLEYLETCLFPPLHAMGSFGGRMHKRATLGSAPHCLRFQRRALLSFGYIAPPFVRLGSGGEEGNLKWGPPPLLPLTLYTKGIALFAQASQQKVFF